MKNKMEKIFEYSFKINDQDFKVKVIELGIFFKIVEENTKIESKPFKDMFHYEKEVETDLIIKFVFWNQTLMNYTDVLKAHLKNALLNSITKEEHYNYKKYFDEKNKFQPKILAEELMEKYKFITFKDNEQMYVYINGCYKPIAETLIKAECKKRLDKEYRINRVNEVIEFIKASTFTERKEEPPNLIPLLNGVYDLNTNELKPHLPDYFFFNVLPIKYDPQAKCPEIEKFLEEITNSKEDIEVLLEVIGYCLHRGYPIAKALLLVGEGSNGKTTFLNLVRKLLGSENVSSISLQDLEENRFSKAFLYHKLANIYADLPDRALIKTGCFKMLTGGDNITAEEKFKLPFNFVNYAKLLFSCNKVPEVYEDTTAFFRRWIIIVFPKEFIGENCDPYKLEKITTEKELSGLFNLVIPRLKRLLERGYFSYSKTTQQLREDYIRKSSPIQAFIMDCLTNDSDSFIEKKSLFNVFCAYCRMYNLPIPSESTFFTRLPNFIPISDFRPEIRNERKRTLKGIRYTEGVSKVSNVSKVFYSLSSRKQDFNNEIFEINDLDNSTYIEIVVKDIPELKEKEKVDIMDTMDIKQIGICEICGKNEKVSLIKIKKLNKKIAICENCLKDMKEDQYIILNDSQKQDEESEDYLLFSGKILKEKFDGIEFFVCKHILKKEIDKEGKEKIQYCNFKTLTFSDIREHALTHNFEKGENKE
jgi:putative DNA primase/helicase